MAKLKFWVRNLIIVLALVISLAGVGTGIYFLLKENNPDNPPVKPDRELSAEQKLFIENVKNMEQVDIDVSVYTGLTLEDGSMLDINSIVYATEKYLVAVDTSINGGKPTFYSTEAESASLTSFVSDQPSGMSIKEVAIDVDYSDYVYISGDYAMLIANGEYCIASLLTGDVVLNQADFEYSSFEDGSIPEVGDYTLESRGISYGYMMVEKTTYEEIDVANQKVSVKVEHIVYPLADVSAKIVFDETTGELVTYSADENHLVFVTTKGTYVYNNKLAVNYEEQVYEMELAMPVLENTFEECEESEVETLGKFMSRSGTIYKAADYHNVQFMDENLVLVSRTTTEEELTDREEIAERDKLYDAVHTEYIFNMQVLVGTVYNIYDLSVGEYLSTIPSFYGVVEILDSPVDNYYFLTQKCYYDYESEGRATTNACFYDSNFNLVLTYNYGHYGDLVFYDGTNFLTSGKNSSRLLDNWGEPTNELLGYTVRSNSIYNGNIVVEGSIFYSIYNTIGETFISDKYTFISEIMNGKVVAFKEATGYYLIDFSAGAVNPTPIYNMATDADSLALLMSSSGYYFTYDADENLYTFHGLNGTTYADISSYSYKTINNQIYLQLTFKNGNKGMIVASPLKELQELNEEDISEFAYNLEQPTVVGTAMGDDFSQSTQGGTETGGVEVTSASVSIRKGVNPDREESRYWIPLSDCTTVNTLGVSAAIGEGGVPTYNYNFNWDFEEKEYDIKSNDDFGISVAAFCDETTFANKYFIFDGMWLSDKYEEVRQKNRTGLLEWYKSRYKNFEGNALPFPYSDDGGETVRDSIDYTNKYGDVSGKFLFYKAVALGTPYGYIISMRYVARIYPNSYDGDSNNGGCYFIDILLVGVDQSSYFNSQGFYLKQYNTRIGGDGEVGYEYYSGEDMISSSYVTCISNTNGSYNSTAELYDNHGSDYYNGSIWSSSLNESAGIYKVGVYSLTYQSTDSGNYLNERFADTEEPVSDAIIVKGDLELTPFTNEFVRTYYDKNTTYLAKPEITDISELFFNIAAPGNKDVGAFLGMNLSGEGDNTTIKDFSYNGSWKLMPTTNYEITKVVFENVQSPGTTFGEEFDYRPSVGLISCQSDGNKIYSSSKTWERYSPDNKDNLKTYKNYDWGLGNYNMELSTDSQLDPLLNNPAKWVSIERDMFSGRYVEYYRSMFCRRMVITYTVDSKHYASTFVYKVDPSSKTEKIDSKRERLFTASIDSSVSDSLNTWYGFYGSAVVNDGIFIGEKRPNLYQFVERCNFGYKLDGLGDKTNNITYVGIDGEFAGVKVNKKDYETWLNGSSEAEEDEKISVSGWKALLWYEPSKLEPIQTPLKAAVQFLYANPGVDDPEGETIENVLWKAGELENVAPSGTKAWLIYPDRDYFEYGEDRSVDFEYGSNYYDFPVTGQCGDTNAEIQAPRGYTITGWTLAENANVGYCAVLSGGTTKTPDEGGIPSWSVTHNSGLGYATFNFTNASCKVDGKFANLAFFNCLGAGKDWTYTKTVHTKLQGSGTHAYVNEGDHNQVQSSYALKFYPVYTPNKYDLDIDITELFNQVKGTNKTLHIVEGAKEGDYTIDHADLKVELPLDSKTNRAIAIHKFLTILESATYDAKGDEKVKLPRMYISTSEGYFYKIKLWGNDLSLSATPQNELDYEKMFDGNDKNKNFFDLSGAVNGLSRDYLPIESFDDKNDLYHGTLRFNVAKAVESMRYDVLANVDSDIHVYDNKDEDRVNENLCDITYNNKSNSMFYISADRRDSAGEIIGDRLWLNGGTTEDKQQWASGNANEAIPQYVITVGNFLNGHMLEFVYFREGESVDTTDAVLVKVYLNGDTLVVEEYLLELNDALTIVEENGEPKVKGTNPTPIIEKVGFNDEGSLEVTFNPIRGGRYVYTEENVPKFEDSQIELDVTIGTCEYSVTVEAKENLDGVDEEDLPFEPVPNDYWSLSEHNKWINPKDPEEDISDEKQAAHIYGVGSTLLITMSNSVFNVPIEGRGFIANQYISGLKITRGGNVVFGDGDTFLNFKHNEGIRSLFVKFGLDPSSYEVPSKLGDEEFNAYRYSFNIACGVAIGGIGSYIHENLVMEFMQLMYGKAINIAQAGSIAAQNATVYSVVVELRDTSDNDNIVYMVLTNHIVMNGEEVDTEKSLGLSAALLYDIGEFTTVDNDDYKFDIFYTKYSSTVTWNADSNGSATEISTDGAKYYMLDKYVDIVTDNSGVHHVTPTETQIYFEDSIGKYIVIFDKKVYVRLVSGIYYDNNVSILKVDRQRMTDADHINDWNDLFGERGLIKNNLEEGTDYLYNLQGNRDDVVRVTLNNKKSSLYAGRGFADEEGNDIYTSEKYFNHARVSPSNTLTYDISVRDGHYIKTIKIYYDDKEYLLEIYGMEMTSDQSEINPMYKLYLVNGDSKTLMKFNADNIYDAGGTNEILSAGFDTTAPVYIVDKIGFAISLERMKYNESKTVISFTFAAISTTAHFQIEYGAYTMLSVGANENLQYSFNEDNAIELYQNFATEPEPENLQKVASINVVKDNVNLNSSNMFILSYIEGNKYAQLNANTFGSKILCFIVLDYALDNNHANGSAFNAAAKDEYIKVESVVESNAMYKLAFDNNVSGFFNNNAGWAFRDKDTQASEQYVVDSLSYINASGEFEAHCNAHIKIVEKTITSQTTSNIDFGANGNNFAVEETEAGLSYDKDGSASHHYYIGADIAGFEYQIASHDSFVEFINAQFATSLENSSYVYDLITTAYGNQIVYTIKSEYGYDFAGATFVFYLPGEGPEELLYTVTISADEIANAVLKAVCAENGDEIVVGTYSLTWSDEAEAHELTLNITNLRVGVTKNDKDYGYDIKLHYNAKEFNVCYDTDYDFGTSNTPSQETRTFTYNVITPLNSGGYIDSTGALQVYDVVDYARIGYSQLGWAFADFYKDEAGHTVDTTAELAAADLTAGNYITQLYSLQSTTEHYNETDAGINWFLSLAEDLGNVFGSVNNGTITMSTVWDAKTYELVLDYNDVTTSDGSSTSTKFTASWVFDMPISVADIANEHLSFDNENYTAENTLLNSLSRVYRLGYTFNGWYFKNETFNADNWTSANLVLQDSHGTDASNWILALDNVSNKTIGYREPKAEGSTVFGKAVYEAMNAEGAWHEGDEENPTPSIYLYAAWNANTYSFAYDLNDRDDGLDGNTFTSLTYFGETDTLVALPGSGVGSTNASLAFANNGAAILSIEFDADISNLLKAYAYRTGYKFLGWYMTRLGESEIFETETDTKQFNLTQLMSMLNVYDSGELLIENDYNEFEWLGNKVDRSLINVNAIETLNTTGAAVEMVDNQLSVTSGNLILLHARWQALEYEINFDLNNWNNDDYTWKDADYHIAGRDNVESGENVNNVSKNVLKFIVTFDEEFGSGKLYHNGILIEDENQISYEFNEYEYVTNGETGYEKLLQIINAHGYSLGTRGFEFALAGDGNGSYVEYQSVNAYTVYNIDYYDNSYYLIDTKLSAGDTYLPTSLNTLDNSNDDKGDLHDTDVNAEIFGNRTFTLFALWTRKNLTVYNTTEKEIYTNYLDKHNTNQVVYSVDKEGYVSYGHTGSSIFDYRDNYTYYVAPATGQYFNELVIKFTDNYTDYSQDKLSNAERGTITVKLSWDDTTRMVSIYEIVCIYKDANNVQQTATIAVSEEDYSYVGANGETLTFYFDASYLGIENNRDLDYLFTGGIEICVSKYQHIQDIRENDETAQNEKNINTYYKNDYNNESCVEYPDSWLAGSGNKDVNYVTVSISGQKSNVEFGGTTVAQTYDVDYYRYIRPTDEMMSHIDEDPESETFGQEVWDSDFFNDWNQYEVYKTITYRYGSSLNTTYNYASNFSFLGWYYYQGHIFNYEEYNNYGGPDEVYQTYQKYLLQEQIDREYTWDWTTLKYVAENGDLIEGIFNKPYDYNAEADPEENGEYTITLAELNMLKLYDFIGVWEAITYTWNWGTLQYVAANGETLDGPDSKPYNYNAEADPSQTGEYSVTLHQYTYNDDVNSYKFDRRAVSGNMSMVAVYFPASIHKVHYYTWANSSSSNCGYEERVATSNQYVLGQKFSASITNDNGQLSRSYSYIEYWELGTNREYYRVGFSGFNSLTSDGTMPTEFSALQFLMQFVNPINYSDYATKFEPIKQKLSIDWTTLRNIIIAEYNLTDYAAANPQELSVALIKQLINDGVYRVENYLLNPEVVSLLNLTAEQTELLANYMLAGTMTHEEAIDIVNNLSVENILVILDYIATDYFGYILINPSENIGYWPDGTYLAGWYLVDDDLYSLIMESDDFKDHVFTFNEDTWNLNLSCFDLPNPEDVIKDLDGNIIYPIKIGGQTYEITKFNTVDPYSGIADVLSRVDKSVHVFAAYNAKRFMFNESDITTSKSIDIQWGVHTEYQFIDKGIVEYQTYEYEDTDAKYIVLSPAQWEIFADAFAGNENIPNAIQYMIAEKNVQVHESYSLAKGSAGVGYYIIAFVYNIKGVTIDGIQKNASYNTQTINIYAENCVYYEPEGEYLTVKDLEDLLVG